eukprot:5639214-Pleurochrysis_carterae.AAC.4
MGYVEHVLPSSSEPFEQLRMLPTCSRTVGPITTVQHCLGIHQLAEISPLDKNASFSCRREAQSLLLPQRFVTAANALLLRASLTAPLHTQSYNHRREAPPPQPRWSPDGANATSA